MSVIYLIRIASADEPNPEKHPDALKLTEQHGHALKRRINDEPLETSSVVERIAESTNRLWIIAKHPERKSREKFRVEFAHVLAKHLG